MRIHLIKEKTLEDFVLKHARSKSSLEDWLEKIKDADWNEPSKIKETFGAADILGKGSNRVVFNLAGNNYRLICKYFFGIKKAHLFVCWIGTHKAYSELCKANEQFTINVY